MKRLKIGQNPKGSSDYKYPLQNFSDIHIHTAPDIKPRLQTDVEAALSAMESKMNCIVLKSHQEPTSGRAKITSDILGFQVYGGVVLNKSVGGLNPYAVKASAELGGKFVWFPTISYPTMQMDWAKVEDILQIVAENEMVLATGHLKPEDIFVLIDMAKSMGIWKIVVNHPLTRVVGASMDEQLEMSKHAYLEHCFVACMELHDNLNPEMIRDSIKKIGAKRCIMATDFGQTHNPQPVNGMKMFTRTMLDKGVSLDEINTMCIKNPQKLIMG